MPMYRKLTTAAAVAALTLGLAACGGGGSDGPTASAPPPPATTPDPMPPAPTPVAVTVPDAMYLDAANMPDGRVHDDRGGHDGHQRRGSLSCAPRAARDCVVTVADDGSVTATGGMVTASLTAAAMTQVAEAKDAKKIADDAAALAMRDRVVGKNRALEGATPMADGATAGTLDENDIRITRGAGAAGRVRVTDPAGYIVADTPAMANGAWAGTHLTRRVARGHAAPVRLHRHRAADTGGVL